METTKYIKMTAVGNCRRMDRRTDMQVTISEEVNADKEIETKYGKNVASEELAFADGLSACNRDYVSSTNHN